MSAQALMWYAVLRGMLLAAIALLPACTSSNPTQQGGYQSGQQTMDPATVNSVRCGSRPLQQQGVDLPIRVASDADLFKYLPRTHAQLLAHGELQAVVLGDSIMNDTFGPQFGGASYHASTAWGMDLVANFYNARIWTIVAVLGSTGAWWYQEGDRVHTYVTKYQPDLVLIGGISNRDDMDALRSVVQQIRAADATTEIVLLSDTVNLTAIPTGPPLVIAADEDSYRARLQQLAEELQVAFMDMRGPYNDFVRRTNAMYSVFDHAYLQRDAVHANDRGREVLRGIVTTYMTTNMTTDDICPT